ncbi:hypothetical protein [Halomonas daqiaonensis]|uniref:hypothetical protein n=1 Tax=Halomonas daqiaonensis TaxID=650850 RepID=UPI001113A1E8|nr:hypothetical protein [Halomonas daqiaonensis]
MAEVADTTLAAVRDLKPCRDQAAARRALESACTECAAQHLRQPRASGAAADPAGGIQCAGRGAGAGLR